MKHYFSPFNSLHFTIINGILHHFIERGNNLRENARRYNLDRPRRPLQQTAGPFCSQRGAVAAACLDLTPLYLTTSIPKPCNKTALDVVRQALILRLRGAKIGKIKVA
uniref:Uncharacterized protein n=1 Tax=Siphoviridae sp. ctVCm11 TaxID=2826358 RepID=A0A8S5QL93_9CAUD|nr:MAG TPA: hypothetical protein [Siphoviridae sp. ctVCm11]